MFWHSKWITGQASYSDLRKNMLITLHTLTYEVDKCNEWFMTTINQVRMIHSGRGTNSLKGRGDRVSVHTHTDTHTTLLNHKQTNQHARLWNQVPWKTPLTKPSSRTGQTSSNVPKTLLASSKRPILLTSSVENNVPGSSSKMCLPHNMCRGNGSTGAFKPLSS